MANGSKTKEKPIAFQDVYGGAHVSEAVKIFFQNYLHVKHGTADSMINLGLGGIRYKNPIYKTQNLVDFSVDYKLTQQDIVFYNKTYPLLINGEGYVEGLRKAFLEKNPASDSETPLVKPENFEKFVQGHTAFAIFAMIQHAKNFQGEIKHVSFEDEMARVCVLTQCTSFNIMNEVRKIAPEIFGVVSPKTTHEAEAADSKTIDLPKASLISLNGKIKEISSSPENGKQEYVKIYGEKSYADLIGKILPKMYGAYLECLSIVMGLAASMPLVGNSIREAGKRLLFFEEAERSKNNKDEAYRISEKKKKEKKEGEEAEKRAKKHPNKELDFKVGGSGLT